MLLIVCFVVGVCGLCGGFFFLGRNLAQEDHEDTLDLLFENISEDENLSYMEKEFVFGVIYDHAPPELGIEFPN